MTATSDTTTDVLPELTGETVDTGRMIAGWATRRDNQPAGTPLTDSQQRCLQTLLAIAPWHRLMLLNPQEATVSLIPDGMRVLLEGTMSTYDDAGLTRLVVAAHDHAVRVELGTWHTSHLGDDGEDDNLGRKVREAISADLGYEADEITAGGFKVTLTARTRDGDWYHSHPTLETATAYYREHPQLRRR